MQNIKRRKPGQARTASSPASPPCKQSMNGYKDKKKAFTPTNGKLKKQVQEYDVIKRNIDSILQTEKQPEREWQTEWG